MVVDKQDRLARPTREDVMIYDFRYSFEFYNMLWGEQAKLLIGNVIPAYNYFARTAAHGWRL